MSGLTLEFVVPRNDPWRKLAGEDGPISHPKPAAHLLLTLAQWHAVRHTWPVDLAVGVSFPNDHDVEDLAEDLPRLALIELQFPKWTDGRAYSQARLLRTRYRFSGEVRETSTRKQGGHVCHHIKCSPPWATIKAMHTSLNRASLAQSEAP